MLSSQIPAKFQIPFANAAGASFVNDIPLASQIGIILGAASLTDGFPPVTFLPVGAGGTPPWGRDFNGLFRQITAWNRWQGAGGGVKFDAAFAAAIGGYPIGATLQSSTPGNVWVSLVDNNLTDPNATPGSPGWVGVGFIQSIQNGTYVSGDDTGSADAYVTAPQPPPVSYVKYQRFQVLISHANLTTTPTLNVQGATGLLGAKLITRPNGGPLNKGDLAVGMVAVFLYDGTKMQLLNAGSSSGGLINVQVITVSGFYNQTSGATKALVFVTGGGGGGGIASIDGGGGGAGATAIQLVQLTGSPISCVIGAGGTAAPGGFFSPPGGNGGASSFGAFASAAGGFGSASSDNAIGPLGFGGSTGSGLVVIPGGDSHYNGGSIFFAGNGGASFWGGGGMGSQNNFFSGGQPGRAFGSGGGGGCFNTSPSFAGNGAQGVIVVLEF